MLPGQRNRIETAGSGACFYLVQLAGPHLPEIIESHASVEALHTAGGTHSGGGMISPVGFGFVEVMRSLVRGHSDNLLLGEIFEM